MRYELTDHEWARSDIGPVEIPQCRLSPPARVIVKNWQNGQKLEHAILNPIRLGERHVD